MKEEKLCSPICEGVKPFLANLKICSWTSSEDNFSHVGTERRYGSALWEIPLLEKRNPSLKVKTRHEFSRVAWSTPCMCHEATLDNQDIRSFFQK